MRKLLIGVLAVAALTAAPTASPGGWATVGVSPADPPDEAGAIWNVRLKVLRHGRTPTDGARPSVTIRNAATGESRKFPARPTGETGVYAAEIVFPTAGTWRYEVDNGLSATGYGESNVQTYAPVEIVAPGASDSGFPTVPVAIAVALGLGLAAALGLVVARRRQPRPAPLPAGR
jgi:hypothetical protein